MSIPNTLSIFINTRIRGSSKIKYSPGMSVEGNDSKQVYFDPLIKLNSSVVNYIPKGLPETEKFTQFFSKNQFNSLIQRTLGNASQPKRDLVQAKKSGVIDNNIRITLNTLFKSGNPFYLSGKRFTIYSYEWENGDWEVQSVKSDKMQKALRPYTSKGYGAYPYPPPYSSPYPYPYPYPSPYAPARYPSAPPIAYAEPIGVDPEALSGDVDPGLSKLERAALGSGVGPILKPKPKKPTKPRKPTPPPGPPPPGPPPPGPPSPPPSSIPPPKNELCRQFLNYYNEGFQKGFIKTTMSPGYMNSINQWTIEKNKASGDCFFEALRDSLNGYNSKAYEKNKIIVPRYYDKTSGLYSVPSLRRLVADYIESPEGERIYDGLVAVTQVEINSLRNPFDAIPNEFRFMVDNRNNILTRDQVAEKISRTSTASERPPGEVVMHPDEYYWGDLIAVACCESVLNIKIVLISTEGIAAAGENGTLVQFTDNHGDIITGTIKNAQQLGLGKYTADVETNNYTTYPNVPVTKLRQIPRYSIYCHDTDANLSNVDRFVFMLYSNDNHFEALYSEKARDNRKYIYNAADIPSYIKYMIFENCYKVLTPADRDDSSYGEIKSLGKFLKDMTTIYDAKIKNGPTAMNTSNKRLMNGGDISGGQGAIRYNVGYDANLTYYIVIDLELYPGDSIPLETKASLACQIRYEKIRQSYADLFGLVYQPKELSVSEDLNKKYIAAKNKTKKENTSYPRYNNNNFTRRR